ncbi:MAG: hypothetical protein A2987_05940 [Omnitrophica bacterium RIFCSPLOWO2_01_FULL_45_10]|nr:MAG: hypothetical protein A2987_05940 [Omnitrophica bacterium RIFCSPLOWO2_01_FULL_45_10]
MVKLKVTFSKTGDMRFISHLDLVRLFQRASRRANLPVFITRGYSPHLKISITRALKLGISSENEEAIFCMNERVEPEKFLIAINEKLPSGVRVRAVEEVN